MKNVLRMNIRVSGINYLLFFTVITHLFWLLSSESSIVTTFSYMFTVIYSYIYLTVLIPQKNLLNVSFLLQRSLPTSIQEVIKGWYYSNYIIIGLISIVNIIPLIIVMDFNEYYLGNILVVLFSTVLTLISFNIMGPSIVKTSSTIKKVICAFIVIVFFAGTLASTMHFMNKDNLILMTILNVISVIFFLGSVRISHKIACNKLQNKFD